MKHLKLFESGTHIVTVVRFTAGESVHGVYIDGNLHKYGDYYHDKIENWIEGFIDGLEWAGMSIEKREIECKDEKINDDVCELADCPPKYLSAISQ